MVTDVKTGRQSMLRRLSLPEVALKDGKFLIGHYSQDMCDLWVVLSHLLLSYTGDTPQPPTRGRCDTWVYTYARPKQISFF